LKFINIFIYCLIIVWGGFNANAQSNKSLKVQLSWLHQSQFAGFYVAEARKHFQKEGLDVTLIPGSYEKNSIKELQNGKVDIAVASLAFAWSEFKPDKPVTNIAQIFESSSLGLLCRASKGVYTPKDIEGKTIGVFDESDKHLVESILNSLKVPLNSVRYISKQKPHGEDLISGKVDCATVYNFDEYWSVLQKGIEFSDLIMINTDKLNIGGMEDGLYVRTESLNSPEFRNELARFVRALRMGWLEAKASPSLALDTVFKMNPDLDRVHEQHALETIITLLPKNFDDFGYFDLKKFNAEKENLFHDNSNKISDVIWTHTIWNNLKETEGQNSPIKRSTKYYLEEFIHLSFFKILIYFGVFTYALSGVLEAIDRNYDIWGRLILGFLSGVGGGTIRDIIIGGSQFPFYYVKDFTYPLGILCIVILATLFHLKYPKSHKSKIFKDVKKYTDIFGFSALVIYGTSISLISNMPWYWATILGALTCAGGGMLRDMITNKEPSTFKGIIYEEVAVIGSLFLILGFYIAGFFEHKPYLVTIFVLASFVFLVTLRFAVYIFNIHYPRSIGGPK